MSETKTECCRVCHESTVLLQAHWHVWELQAYTLPVCHAPYQKTAPKLSFLMHLYAVVNARRTVIKQCLTLHLVFVQVVGFLPTGWMYEMKRKSFPVREKGYCFIHLVPYSEHSSYSELREYVQFLHPHKVCPWA